MLLLRDSRLITQDGLQDDVMHSSETVGSVILENLGLTVLRKGLFGNVTRRFSYLSARFNFELTEIEPGAFDGIRQVSQINLSFCDLTDEGMPPDIFASIANPRFPVYIELMDNPRMTEEPRACKIEGIRCGNIGN